MVPTDGADPRQPSSTNSILIFGSQARNPLPALLHKLLINLDPTRAVARVSPSSSPPSHLANALAAHAPDLVISTLGTAHPSAQDDAAAQQIALIDACITACVPRLLLVPLRAAATSTSESEREGDADADGQDRRGWEGVTAVEAQARVLSHLRAVANNGMEAEAGDAEVAELEQGHQQKRTRKSRKLEWVGVACGTTLDAALVDGRFGVDMKWASAEVMGDGTSEFGASSAAWVCRTVAAVVEHWDRIPRNQVVHVAGCVTTANDVLRCLEAATSQEYLVGFVSVDEAVSEARKRIERGFVDRGADMLERSLLFDHSRALGAVEAFKDRTAHGLLGLGRESVRDIVGVAVHEFRHRQDTAGCGCG